MTTSKTFFLLFPRRVIVKSFDSIATKIEWQWLKKVNKVSYNYSDFIGCSFFSLDI